VRISGVGGTPLGASDDAVSLSVIATRSALAGAASAPLWSAQVHADILEVVAGTTVLRHRLCGAQTP
jgi:hypothetical protein